MAPRRPRDRRICRRRDSDATTETSILDGMDAPTMEHA